MNTERIGKIAKLARYPIKSMAGIEMKTSLLEWNGLKGDRRLGIRQIGKSGNFPWLTASKMPELLQYKPTDFDTDSADLEPSRIQTPDGEFFEIGSEQLRNDLRRRSDCEVEIMAFKNGIFDDSPISLITSSTISHLCSDAGVANDGRRFRANIEVSLDQPLPFADDQWVGSLISFGESVNSPACFVTKRDVRCKMIGLDPDSSVYDPSVIKSAVHLNNNHAGVYATVVRVGSLRIGDSIFVTNLSGT